MREYVTEALVLNKEPRGELDGRYIFFTQKFGKISGKATSSRKITSKLAGHLEPGTFTTVRFVERDAGLGNGNGNGNGNGIAQIVDALRYGNSAATLSDLSILTRLIAEYEPDEILWAALLEAGILHDGAAAPADGGTNPASWSWHRILGHLGWDPMNAVCERCSAIGAGLSENRAGNRAGHAYIATGKPEIFFIRNMEFYCRSCASKLPPDELIFL